VTLADVRARAITFDFNGTLSDDEPILFEVFAGLFAERGRPLTAEDYFGILAGLSDTEIVRTWLGDRDDLEAVVAERVERYRRAVHDGSSISEDMRRAVRLAADRVPVPAEHRGPPETSGLRALHTAMAQGRLDGFRAGVVAFELDTAPADVADAVVTSLDSHLGDDAAKLRQRIRVLLARISPDLVRERAQKARNNTGLRRWVAEPGVDEWHGTFPSEDAATAWAAIDRLAHDLVAAGTCTNVEQARGKALTDLVTGHSTVDVQVVLTVPADCVPTSARAPQGDEPAATIRTSTPDTNVSAPACAAEDPTQTPATDVSAPARAAEELSPTQDTGDGASVTPLDGGRDHDLVQVQGARPSEPLLVRRGWLRDHLAKQPPRPKRGRAKVTPAFVPCDPLTGARLDPHDHLTTDAYRPSAELTALVKVRDGRCRFPGCSVAARFCDLDHVRPWPAGRTAARNLLTLCRRHHRIKQRPGWRVRLAPDGSTTWTDPTGRLRTTKPLDALQALVLAPEPTEHEPRTPTADTTTDDGLGPATSTTTPSAPTLGCSVLETILEVRAEHAQAAGHNWFGASTHRRCTSSVDLRAGIARRRARAAFPDLPPF
jgi:hypothetical protein